MIVGHHTISFFLVTVMHESWLFVAEDCNSIHFLSDNLLVL